MGQQQAAKGSSLLADGFAWSLNVVSAVAIVFVNKVLMRGKGGYGFSFGERRTPGSMAYWPSGGRVSSSCCCIMSHP